METDLKIVLIGAASPQRWMGGTMAFDACADLHSVHGSLSGEDRRDSVAESVTRMPSRNSCTCSGAYYTGE